MTKFAGCLLIALGLVAASLPASAAEQPKPPIVSLAKSSDGKFEVVRRGGTPGTGAWTAHLSDGSLFLRRVDSGKLIRELESKTAPLGDQFACDCGTISSGQAHMGTFAEDGKVFAAFTYGVRIDQCLNLPRVTGGAGMLALWDVEYGKCIGSGMSAVIYHRMACVGDGALLATWAPGDVLVRGRGLPPRAQAQEHEPAPGNFMLWDALTGQPVVAPFAVPSGFTEELTGTSYEPKGGLLIFRFKDGTEKRWDLRDAVRRKWAGKEPSEAEWKTLVDELAADGPKACSAMGWLITEPKVAVPLLQKRLQPVEKVDAERLSRLIANLDARSFDARETAGNELLAIGTPALVELHKLLDKGPPLEVAQRARALVETLVERIGPLSPEERFSLRAVRVLERVDTPESRQTLQELSRGGDHARLTREARAALERLTKAK